MKEWCYMKDIGQRLKDTRESIGISVEEAAEDLKVKPSQIENIENGDIESFKDIFYLKYFIRDYAKYLGLAYTDVVDEFNEYLFDYTSKISIEEIKKAKKNQKEKEVEIDDHVSSPYTKGYKRKKTPLQKISIILVLILICICIYFLIQMFITGDFSL